MNSSAAIDVCSNTETFMKLATTALTLAWVAFTHNICSVCELVWPLWPLALFRELWYY